MPSVLSPFFPPCLPWYRTICGKKVPFPSLAGSEVSQLQAKLATLVALLEAVMMIPRDPNLRAHRGKNGGTAA